jgi:hypothetical protein
MHATPDQPVQRVTVRISKASLNDAERGHDTAKLLKERYETRVSAIRRFTDRLHVTRGKAEPDWTAALRELGIGPDEIENLVSQTRKELLLT